MHSIGQKLSLGFGILVIISAATAYRVSGKVEALREIQDEVVGVRVPTMLNAEQLAGTVQSSLAELRGYVLLGDQRMVESRSESWNRLDTYLGELRGNLDSDEQVEAILEVAAACRLAQDEVEQLAHTPGNEPAKEILINEAGPIAARMTVALSTMISEEENLEATLQRKRLLGDMAETRGFLASSLAALRTYLVSGQEEDSLAFEREWKAHEESGGLLQGQINILTSGQIEALSDYTSAFDEFDSLPAVMMQIRSSGRWNLALAKMRDEAAPQAQQLNDLLRELVSEQRIEMEAGAIKLAEHSASARTFMISSGIATALLGLMIGFFLTRHIRSRLNAQVGTVRLIAETKNLTTRAQVTGKDELTELARAVNDLSSSFDSALQSVTDTSSVINAGTQKIADASREIAQGSTQQAATFQEISASLTELNGGTQSMADGSAKAAELSRDAKKAADRGRVEVDSMASIMAEIQESSTEISNVIQIIDEIAFQTNLLALNAAVEAARAGDSGKGFAVVAEEVRSLALRSANAASDIGSMIEVAIRRSKAGKGAANDVQEVLQEIADRIGKVNDIVDVIESDSTSQASGIHQITTAVSDLDHVTQSNASRAENLAGAAQQSREQVEKMRSFIDVFTTSQAA